VERFNRWRRRNPVVAGLTSAVASLLVATIAILAISNTQIRRESEARADALKQKDAALATARQAVDEMLTEVANKKFSNAPVAHPLRVALLKDALRFYEGLAKLAESEGSLGPEMAQVLESMAGLQRELGQSQEAAQSLRRGLALLRASEDADGSLIAERAAKMELVLAYTMGESLDSERAADPTVESQYRRALRLLQDLERRWPERRQPYVICLRYLAERAFQRGDRVEAERLWQEAIAKGEAYLAQQPRDVDTRVSVCWAGIEYYNRLLRGLVERRSETEAILQSALHHAQLSLGEDPKSSQAREAAASVKLSLGTHYCQTGQPDRAIQLYENAVAMIESLCTDFPWTASYWGTLQWFHDDIPANLRAQGRLEQGRDALRKYSAWLNDIGPKVPAEPGPQKLLRQARRYLVKQLRAVGLSQEAEGMARLAD
jgi:hypothetical protein